MYIFQMLFHFCRIFLVITFTTNVFSQNHNFRTLDSLEYIYLTDIDNVSNDVTLKRIHRFLKAVDHSNINDSIYFIKKEKAVTNLILLHSRTRNADSARYYYNQAINTFKSTKERVEAHRIRALLEFFDLQIDQSLYYYGLALEEAKLLDTDEFKTKILIDLSLFYRYAEDYDSAAQIIDKLKRSITDSTKAFNLFRIRYEDFYVKTHQEKYQEALKVLHQIDTTDILSSSIILRGYHEAFVDAYINLQKYDSALYHNDIAVNSPKSAASFSPIDDYTYYANIYHNKGEDDKALFYLNKIPDTSAVNNSNYSLKDFHEWSYKVHKALGNDVLALINFEKYHDIKSVIDKEIRQKQAGIIKYKLDKDKTLNALKIKQAKTESAQKQKLYVMTVLFIVFLAIVLIIFFIHKYKQDKKQLKLVQSTKLFSLKNQYIESITHEFKTPVSINVGYVDLIKSNILNPLKVADYADKLQNIQQGLLNNLNELLTFIKLENHVSIQAHHLETLLLYDFTKLKLQAFEPICLHKGIRLHYQTNINPKQSFKFDYSKLDKVIGNLVDNAIKFSNVNQNIYINFMINKASISLIVKDEGIGISKTDQANIFNRFYQTQAGKETQGFGIGLFLVREIVNTWNGTITVDSELNKGTEFRIDIPFSSNELQDLKSDLHKMAFFEEEKSKYKPTTATILIVEDQFEMAEYIEDILTLEYVCDYAHDGNEALECLDRQDYDLIISDYKMPNMNGVQLKKEIDIDKKKSLIPFILISASTIQEDISELLKRKNVVYLEKPLKKDNLLDVINGYIGLKHNKDKITTLKELDDFKNKKSTFIHKTNAFILKNLQNENLKVQDIAEHLNLSSGQFSREIREYTGQTASKILLEIRLLKAYEFIKVSKFKTISELMYNAGFNSRSYFYNKFEERFGVKVGDMVKEYKN